MAPMTQMEEKRREECKEGNTEMEWEWGEWE